MGSLIELNDTLRISKSQGFPKELDLEKHLKSPYKLEDFENKVYEFSEKPKIRVYQQPPVRCFLVEDKDDKWVYWGLCHILEITHDYIGQKTSGKFKIIYINSPEEMKTAGLIVHTEAKTRYFTGDK